MKAKGKSGRRKYPEHIKPPLLPLAIRIPVPKGKRRALAKELKALGLSEPEIDKAFSRANASRLARRIKLFRELGLSGKGLAYHFYRRERDEVVRPFLEHVIAVRSGKKLQPSQREKLDYLRAKNFPEKVAMAIARSGSRPEKVKERVEYLEGLELDEGVYGRKKIPFDALVELAKIHTLALLEKTIYSLKLQWREERAREWLLQHPKLNWTEKRIKTGTHLSAFGLRQRAEMLLARGIVPSFDDVVKVRLTKGKGAVKQAVKQAVDKRKRVAKRESEAEKRKAFIEKSFLAAGVRLPPYISKRLTEQRIVNMLNYLEEKDVPLRRLAEKGWLGWFQFNEARFKRAVDKESKGKPQGNLLSERKSAAILADLKKGDKAMMVIARKHRVSTNSVILVRNKNFIFSQKEMQKVKPEMERLLGSLFAGRKDELAYRVLKNDIGLPDKEIAFLMAAFPRGELEAKVSLFLNSGLRSLAGGSFKAFQEYRKFMRFPLEDLRRTRVPALVKRFKALEG